LFVENGADVKVKLASHWNATLLHILCKYYPHSNLSNLVHLLVDNGVDINQTSAVKWTALNTLFINYPHDNLVDLIRLFIDKGADLSVTTTNGLNALYLVAGFQREHPKILEVARLLIENGVDVSLNHPDRKFNFSSPLEFLFRNQPTHFTKEYVIDLVKLLTPDGWTILHSFCRYYVHKDLIDFLRSLIENGDSVIDINVKISPDDGDTALHLLCQHYHHDDLIKLIELLIDNGANTNEKNSTGQTALHLLCASYTHENLINIVKLLIDQGTDVNAKQTDGVTALHLLCGSYIHSNLIDLLGFFIYKGADMTRNTQGSGMNPLHFLCANNAQRENLANIVRFLIGKGIDVAIISVMGFTALDQWTTFVLFETSTKK